MQWLFPVIIMVAIYLFLRGHDLPGGGFAAGVTMSIALILQYMAGGTRWIEARLRILPISWIGLGLLCAALTGMGAWLFGYPFLTSHFRYLDLPGIGKVPAATALLFDLGVFAVVVGATVLILIALAHQSIRRPRPAPAAGSRAADEGERMMELIFALAVGILTASGVWLLLRPRTFQVIIGLSLLSYAVNLFIFGMGRLRVGAPPVLETPRPSTRRSTPIRCRRRWSSPPSSSASR